MPNSIIINGRLKKVLGKAGTSFQWVRLEENRYLIVIPKTFAAELGDSFVVVTKEKFKSFKKEFFK